MGKKRKGNEHKVRKEPSSVVLSACPMAKNEEAMLLMCLASIKNHVDEIIIVDSGSTDGTFEIIKSYGTRIYNHPWENEFSKLRNQTLSYSTGDWLFQRDAAVRA